MAHHRVTSGRVIAFAVVTLLCLLAHCEMIQATTYVVGDSDGWDYDVGTWPTGKSFKARDILVFNYPPQVHNVVALDKGGYDTCTVTKGSKTYTSGHDQITLVKGDNYFICGFIGHCSGFGMKIAIHAA